MASPKRYRLDRSPEEFRRGLSALKKAGIIDVDVRRAQPGWVRSAGPRGGRYTLTELLNRYDNIVSGKATVIAPPKVPGKINTKIYEKTKQGNLIIPHAATEKVSVTKSGEIKRTHIYGISRTEVNVEYRNLPQYFEALKAKEKELQKSKLKNRKFAFHYYGGHSQLFENMDQLIEYLEEDGSGSLQLLQDMNRLSSRDMNEIFRNLEIVETTSKAWERSKATTKKKQKEQRKFKHKQPSRKEILNRLKQGPGWKLDEYRKKRAAAARKYRAAMTPARKKEESRKAVERAKRRKK